MRRTLAGLLIAAACAATPTVAQSRHSSAAPALPDFDVMEQSIVDLQAAMEAGTVTSHALVVSLPGADSRVRSRRTALERDVRSILWRSTPPTRSIASAASDGCADRCTASRSSSRTTTTRPTCRRPAARSHSPGSARRDAFQVKRLREAGAVILGKTNMHELAPASRPSARSAGRPAIRTTLHATQADPAAEPGGSRREFRGGRHGQRHVRIDSHPLGE